MMYQQKRPTASVASPDKNMAMPIVKANTVIQERILFRLPVR